MKEKATKEDIKQIAEFMAEVLDDKKANDVEILDISDRSQLADYFVIASGNSNTQVRALVSEVEQKTEEKFDLKPKFSEGFDSRKWILLDYGDIVLHVFIESEREYYNLERLWR